MKKTILLLVAVLFILRLSGQGTSCSTAVQVCLDSNVNNTYPASTGVPSPTYGVYPNYGCLCTIPNPAWYYLKVGTPGNIVIHISTTPAHDADFICYGPFASIASACPNMLTGNCTSCGSTGCPNNSTSPTYYPSGNIADCSYDAAVTENCHINNALAGQYYILVITNYSNQACNINFTQTNQGQAGAGSTNCDFLSTIVGYSSYCAGDTIKLTNDSINGALYFWDGPNGWTSTLQKPVRLNATPSMSGYYNCTLMLGSTLIGPYSTIVTVHPNPIITVTSGSICIGDTAVLLASGANTYIWNNLQTINPIIVSPPTTTLYTVIGKDSNNCKSQANAIVTVYNTIPIITLSGNVLTSSSATGNQWMLNGIPIPGETGQSFTLPMDNIDTVYYSVIVTNNMGCSAISNIITILPAGIDELSNNNSVMIYPNPIKNKLSIEINSKTKESFEIVNNVGQTVYTSYIYKTATVNTTAFAKGIYFIKLKTAKGIVVKKFVKE